MKRWIIIFTGALIFVYLLTAAMSHSGPPNRKEYKKRDKWAIGIYAGKSPFKLVSATKNNPVITDDDITDVRARYVADPFMIKVKSTWYMFFEIMNDITRQGDIGYATSEDGLNWKYKQVVIDESFHLSYPYIFEFNGEFYMVPECHNIYEVRLYKAVEFPKKWMLVKRLFIGNHVDPSILRYNNKWWLFTGSRDGKTKFTRLFYADDLTGPWIEHPKSPFCKGDEHRNRPGGRVMMIKGKLIRFAQDDDPSYGLAVRAIEITKLTTTDYKEKEIKGSPVLKGSGKGWNASRMHTLDPHELSPNSWIACVDGRR
jgi:hypothetical protein